MPEHPDQFVNVRPRLVLGHDPGMDADETGAGQAIDPADGQDGQGLALVRPAFRDNADPVEFAVALVLELAARDVRRMVGSTRWRRLHAKRVAQEAHVIQWITVPL